jgi:3'-phosphoadenosine 5'-phosphosulfate sulfotransferase (PAPS reductase)/FAD synthetase
VTSDSPASAVLLHLASLAFWPGRVPFAVVDPESDLDGVDSVAQRFDAVLDGADETAERVFSVHDELGQLDPRPQLWELYNGRRRPGQHVRVFPLSRWTERDIAVYLADVCPVS